MIRLRRWGCQKVFKVHFHCPYARQLKLTSYESWSERILIGVEQRFYRYAAEALRLLSRCIVIYRV